MSRVVKNILPGGDGAGDPAPRNWGRFLVASGIFLVYESVLIIVFGDYFYPGVISETGVWLMVAAAALGYLVYGATAGAPVSVFFALAIPALVAWNVDAPVPSAAWGGENLPLYMKWILLTFVFLPAWTLGYLGSMLAEDKRNGRIRRR